ncbi:MAG: hypothetical protein AAGI53_04905 [Planctomycetota bacterium]
MSALPDQIISIDDFIDGNHPNLDVAERIAIAVVAAITSDAHTVIGVNVNGLSGVSSSFFNLFFTIVFEACGRETTRDRVVVLSDSNAMSAIVQRSREAVLGDAA